MDVIITGRNMELDDSLKKYITRKVSKFERIYSRILNANVVLDVEKSRKNVEIILQLRRNKVVAKESSIDLYSSVDGALEKISRQLKKLNGRVISKRRKRMLKTIMRPAMMFGQYEEESMDGNIDFTIIKSDKFVGRPMQPIEAKETLDLTEKEFVMFRNSETGQPNVLYRKSDGNFGLIEPTE